MSTTRLSIGTAYIVLMAGVIYEYVSLYRTYPVLNGRAVSGTLAGTVMEAAIAIYITGMFFAWLWAVRGKNGFLIIVAMTIPWLVALILYLFARGLSGM